MTSRSLGTSRRAALLLAAVALLAGLAACSSSGAKSVDGGGTGSGSSSGDGGSSDAAAVEDTTPTTPPGPPMSSCKSVVHIGDSTSIGLMSPAYLPKPEERIDAQYARVGVTSTRAEISGARSIVEHLKNQLNAEDVAKQVKATGYQGCWVLALGTTDAADIAAGSNHSQDERIDKMMAVIGDDPVLWVNVKTLETTGDWANVNMQVFDQHLDAAKDRYPNLQVYDWSSVVQDPWFTKDQIHYTSSGYAQRARLIADALAAQIPATS
ncbi:MAG: SGNH/GDSL hydrolase family protein [Acidimicrobiales bacterium]